MFTYVRMNNDGNWTKISNSVFKTMIFTYFDLLFIDSYNDDTFIDTYFDLLFY